MKKPRGPIETKLFAGVGGVAVGKPISDVLLWCLGVWLWNAPSTGPKSDAAGAFVPAPWRGLIEWLVPVILGAVAYYWAPHTHRPDLALTEEPVQWEVEPAAGGPVPHVVHRNDAHDHPTEPIPKTKTKTEDLGLELLAGE